MASNAWIYAQVLAIVIAFVGIMRPFLAPLLPKDSDQRDGALRLLTLALTVGGGIGVYQWKDSALAQVAGSGLVFGLAALGTYHAAITGRGPATPPDGSGSTAGLPSISIPPLPTPLNTAGLYQPTSITYPGDNFPTITFNNTAAAPSPMSSVVPAPVEHAPFTLIQGGSPSPAGQVNVFPPSEIPHG